MRVLDGPDFDLVNYRGYPVLLNIFATWCDACQNEQSCLVEAANTYYARGLRIVGLNYREPDDTVRAYRKRYGIPYPIAMDKRGYFVDNMELGNADSDLRFPASLFFTPDGYLNCYKIGSMSADELTYRIQTFLKDAPPTAASPTPIPTASS